jgi:hypothetical protein
MVCRMPSVGTLTVTVLPLILIESGLRLGKRVIPVLVNNADIPSADELPEPLGPLGRRNAVPSASPRCGDYVAPGPVPARATRRLALALPCALYRPLQPAPVNCACSFPSISQSSQSV